MTGLNTKRVPPIHQAMMTLTDVWTVTLCYPMFI